MSYWDFTDQILQKNNDNQICNRWYKWLRFKGKERKCEVNFKTRILEFDNNFKFVIDWSLMFLSILIFNLIETIV